MTESCPLVLIRWLDSRQPSPVDAPSASDILVGGGVPVENHLRILDGELRRGSSKLVKRRP
jgi:hypothetical protein